jgi:hypothetical protein
MFYTGECQSSGLVRRASVALSGSDGVDAVRLADTIEKFFVAPKAGPTGDFPCTASIHEKQNSLNFALLSEFRLSSNGLSMKLGCGNARNWCASPSKETILARESIAFFRQRSATLRRRRFSLGMGSIAWIQDCRKSSGAFALRALQRLAPSLPSPALNAGEVASVASRRGHV